MKLRTLGLASLLLLPSVAPAAPNYDLNWYVASGGGDNAATSANFRMGASAAQPAAGEATSPSFRLGIGFWYGAALCDCPFQADLDASGSVDAVDLAIEIDIVFFGAADLQDSQCPTTRGDFNNDGAPDAVDLAELIDHVFFGGAGSVDSCL